MTILYRIRSLALLFILFLLVAWREGAVKGRVKTEVKTAYSVKCDSIEGCHCILENKEISIYDSFAHILECSLYMDTICTGKTFYYYNDKGLLSEEVRMINDTGWTDKILTYYNDKGQQSEKNLIDIFLP